MLLDSRQSSRKLVIPPEKIILNMKKNKKIKSYLYDISEGGISCIITDKEDANFLNEGCECFIKSEKIGNKKVKILYKIVKKDGEGVRVGAKFI